MSGRVFFVAIVHVALFAELRADEAIRRDGTHVSVDLSFSLNGQFVLRSRDRNQPIGDLEFIRFARKVPAEPPLPLWHQIHLGRGELLLGAVMKLDATHLHLRTAWADSQPIPRTAIERVTNPPGTRPIFFDAFGGDLSNWEAAGGQRIASGKLTLDRARQSVQAKLTKPLAAGRVAVGFESGRTKARRCIFGLYFERDGKSNVVSIELVDPGERYKVVSAGVPAHDGKLRREPGSHRITAEFDRDLLDIFVDDLVLWSQRSGPGVLQAMRLSAEGEGNEAANIADVLVAEPQPVGELRSWADLTADAVRSPSEGETFGEIIAAGPSGLTLKTKERDLVLPWPKIAEFAFRRGPVNESATAGEHVQVRIRSKDGVRDVLSGAVKAFDDKSLVLIHPVLGEVTIPRNRLEEIRPLYYGRQIPIDTTPRHLGDRPAFGFSVPKPEGLWLTRSVKITKSAADGYLIVDAAHVGGKTTPFEMRVAGESLGSLNRLADRADFRVRTYRLPLPAIRPDEIEIKLELRPPKDGGRVNGIDLRGLHLELHDER
jgi:hypothetical protein